MPDEVRHFKSDYHAFKTGLFQAMLTSFGVDSTVHTDSQGNYTPHIFATLDGVEIRIEVHDDLSDPLARE